MCNHANISLALGLVALVFLALGPFVWFAGLAAAVLACVAIAFGHLARSGPAVGARKKPIAGLVIGYSVTVVLIAVMISVPFLMMNAHRTKRMDPLRTITNAAIRFKSVSHRYPTDLAELGKEGLIDTQLASGTKFGYSFTLQSTSNTIFVSASPLPGSSQRSYCMDDKVVLHYAPAGQECTLQSPVLK